MDQEVVKLKTSVPTEPGLIKIIIIIIIRASNAYFWWVIHITSGGVKPNTSSGAIIITSGGWYPYVMTADCRDDKDIKKQFMRQNIVGNMLVRKFSFAPIEAKIQLLIQVIFLPHLWMCS